MYIKKTKINKKKKYLKKIKKKKNKKKKKYVKNVNKKHTYQHAF